MKLTAVLVFLLLFFASCEKDQVQPPEPYSPNIIPPAESLIVGDSTYHNIDFVSYSPVIELESYNTSVFHDIDVDLDGEPDFQFEVWATYPLAGGWFNGCFVKIRGLKQEAEISLDPLYVDSTWGYPRQYIVNDTLFQNSNWRSGQLNISSNGDVPNDGCMGPGCPCQSYGPWFSKTDKYIGIRMNYENASPVLGWIKISLPSTSVSYGQTLVIHEYGYDL